MLVFIIAGSVVLADQAVKALAAGWLAQLPNNTFPLWEGVFHLTYAQNFGAAFGMLQNARWFFLIITVLCCGGIIWFLRRERKRMHLLMKVSLALILGGALGNFIDRAVLGYVRDMFYVILVDFAIFNVADAAVSVGSVLLFLDLLFLRGKVYLEDKPKPSPEPPEENA
ncbi:MAG: signal peptidase II [Christensenellaceae bacterium]|jgi:signal peptidase II|nr:signal peptidase II [Christensenellaceae bacterium]